ncbi:hypothetical protein Poli38472_002554 [Pythium oligandrum]|uniref:Uncharacterized protein n=1 Tax=Pythium oligandrum TaxID=41045 RepID=A0A8K1FMF8_PYTOL|nr:hypothetical protein Poli38472_002554 [Pythium oligandrum]|eukprot:TMW63613.1 hypothetical protein Poli38472_002554 [Pythium oligandrum]
MEKKDQVTAALAFPPVMAFVMALRTWPWHFKFAFVCALLSFFTFCDGWYFVRLGLVHCSERFDHWRKMPRKHLFAMSFLNGRVLPGDIDRNAHCNNARFLRECGFGRRDFWHRNGMWEIIRANDCNLVVGAQSVRYRRELSLGHAYTLETRLMHWDDRAFYLEHRFVTTDYKTNQSFVHAIVLVKNSVIGKLSPSKLIEKLPDVGAYETKCPAMTRELQHWIDYNTASSKILREEAQK